MAKRLVAKNKKAGFDVEVEQRFEAGIVLTGDEVKSIREGRAQLAGGYVRFLKSKKGVLEASVIGLHLSQALNPERSKKLLLHKKELQELETALSSKGKTAVALAVYFDRGWAKLTVGVGVGRKQHDKRQLLKERDLDRDGRSALKSRR